MVQAGEQRKGPKRWAIYVFVPQDLYAGQSLFKQVWKHVWHKLDFGLFKQDVGRHVWRKKGARAT